MNNQYPTIFNMLKLNPNEEFKTDINNELKYRVNDNLEFEVFNPAEGIWMLEEDYTVIDLLTELVKIAR